MRAVLMLAVAFAGWPCTMLRVDPGVTVSEVGATTLIVPGDEPGSWSLRRYEDGAFVRVDLGSHPGPEAAAAEARKRGYEVYMFSMGTGPQAEVLSLPRPPADSSPQRGDGE